MELFDAMRTQGTTRYFDERDVPDTVLHRAFDAARYGPQGGNRQPVRFIVVRRPEVKQQLAEWYLPPWKAYLAQAMGGRVELGALPRTVRAADEFAEHFAEIPVLVVVCAELAGLHPTDTELGRLSIVGGGSVYPIVQNFMLACRNEGVGTALTTLLCLVEPQVKDLLGIPDDFATAACVAVGYPARGFPSSLTRMAVEELAFSERFGQPFSPADGS